MNKTVWIVFFNDDTLEFISAHSSKENAKRGVINAISDYRLGGKEKDYVIKEITLDETTND